MDQELNTAPATLYAAAGGIIKHEDLTAPAIVDLQYRSNDPLVVELTITAFIDAMFGVHAETTHWFVGRDLIAEGMLSAEPRGDGDVAVGYDQHTDRLRMVFTDGNPDRNPDGKRGTHQLLLDHPQSIRVLLRHSYRLIPTPSMDVDALLADIFGSHP